MYRLIKDLKKGEEVSEEFAKLLPDFVEKESKDWKPKLGEGYWFVDAEGIVSQTANEDMIVDKWQIKIGNYFRTQAEAERHRDKQEAEAELRELAEGYEWREGGYNHLIRWVREEGFYGTYYSHTKGADIYFESREKAQHAIDTLGKEKLKLIFNIK